MYSIETKLPEYVNICLTVAGRLSVHVTRALRDETGVFLCRIWLGSLRGRSWGRQFCFLKEHPVAGST